MIRGSCLCGDHRFELEGPLEFNHHCHCGFCRKHHGSAFASLVGVAPERLRHERGETIRYHASPGVARESCARCGTALPQHIEGLAVFVPAGCLDDLDVAMELHIFAASKAPWYEIADGLPAFDAYPPGIDTASQPTRQNPDPKTGARGSCLCGAVRYVAEGPALAARYCHCSRCRKARAAAHASNLVMPEQGLRFTAGQELVRRYQIPEARFFTQSFCERCGSKVPTVDAGRQIAIVPLGGLDDPPPRPPGEHIWTADVPAWSGIYDGLPRYEGPPPG
jgi:hypothetical protein